MIRRRASPSQAGTSLDLPLSGSLLLSTGGLQTGIEPHPHAGGQPNRELPAGHLDRVWPDAGPEGIL